MLCSLTLIPLFVFSHTPRPPSLRYRPAWAPLPHRTLGSMSSLGAQLGLVIANSVRFMQDKLTSYFEISANNDAYATLGFLGINIDLLRAR